MISNKLFFLRFFFQFIFADSDSAVNSSGLLENDNIVVSRKDNCYIFSAVVKKPFSTRKLNGAETMLKKAGAGK